MNDDLALLRRYVEERSEEAFSELVRRHIGMVFGTARRRVAGDAHLAEDIVQGVFIDFARKARGLLGRENLTGWLYVATCRGAAEAVRKERRRKTREQYTCTMETMLTSAPAPESDWDRLRPLLDDLVLELREDDREAVILRFFSQRTFAEIGAALRLSEEAARKRVERAVEKMRMKLADRGVTSTTGALSVVLAGEAGGAIPAAVAAKIAGVALGHVSGLGAVASSFSIANGLTSGGAICAAVLLGLTAIVSQRQINADLRAKIADGETRDRTRDELRSENLRLDRQAAEAARLREAAAGLPELRARIAAFAPTSTLAPARVSVVAAANPQEVTVTERNTIMWGQDFVNLEQFLERLRTYQSQHPGEEAQVVVRGKPGANFAAVAYVVEEASKVSLANIAIDSAAVPEPSLNWFHRRPQRNAPVGKAAPGVPPPTGGP